MNIEAINGLAVRWFSPSRLRAAKANCVGDTQGELLLRITTNAIKTRRASYSFRQKILLVARCLGHENEPSWKRQKAVRELVRRVV